MEPIRYIDLATLEEKFKKGIPLKEVDRLRTAWTASNVPVMDHIRYLLAIRALEIRDDVLIAVRVPVAA